MGHVVYRVSVNIMESQISKEKYLEYHDLLTEEYYGDNPRSLTKDEFDELHGLNWTALELELERTGEDLAVSG